MAALYADEDVPQHVVEELRRSGHDVLTAIEAGLANRRIPDAAALEFAMEQGRAFVTMNRRDFRRLHRSGVVHAGLMLATRSDPGGIAQRIDDVLGTFAGLANRCINVRADRYEEVARDTTSC